MKPKEIQKRLEADGWFELAGKKTGHRHFKHPVKQGKVTVPYHAGDVNPITLKSIEKQSGVKMS
ncbi:MAG: type II toxin-antitoxin system HicA family toxin [Pseudomonadota bacterium]